MFNLSQQVVWFFCLFLQIKNTHGLEITYWTLKGYPHYALGAIFWEQICYDFSFVKFLI